MTNPGYPVGRAAKNSFFDQSTRVLARTNTSTTIVNETGKTSLFTYTVPAHMLGTDRSIRITLNGTIVNDTGANQTMTWSVDYGSTTLWSDAWGSVYDPGASDLIQGYRVEYMLSVLDNLDSTRGQIVSGAYHIGEALTGPDTWGNFGSTGARSVTGFGGYSAEDTSTALDLVFSSQFGLASAVLSITLDNALVELLP